MRSESLVLDRRWPREFDEFDLHIISFSLSIDMTPEELESALEAFSAEAYSKLDNLCKSIVNDREQLSDGYCMDWIVCIML